MVSGEWQVGTSDFLPLTTHLLTTHSSFQGFHGRLAVLFQPFQELADAGCGQGDAGIGAAIVKSQGVTIRSESVTTGKDDIVNVPVALIGLLRPKDPRIAAENALLGSMQIKESHAQPIQAASRGAMDVRAGVRTGADREVD